jgi:hypothetical protein
VGVAVATEVGDEVAARRQSADVAAHVARRGTRLARDRWGLGAARPGRVLRPFEAPLVDRAHPCRYFADPHVIGPCRRDARPKPGHNTTRSLVASFAPQLPTSCGPYSR